MATFSPTIILDQNCLDFANSQNCELSKVRCNLTSSTYLYSCQCSPDDRECEQLRPGLGEAPGINYSRRCPCSPPASSFSSTSIFAIVLAAMIITCIIANLTTRRFIVCLMKRRAAVRQDPTSIEVVTEREYAAWREWETALRNIETHIANNAVVQSPTAQDDQRVANIEIILDRDMSSSGDVEVRAGSGNSVENSLDLVVVAFEQVEETPYDRRTESDARTNIDGSSRKFSSTGKSLIGEEIGNFALKIHAAEDLA